MLLFTACEGENTDPLTIEDIFRESGIEFKKFSAEFGDVFFETNVASGLKSNNQLVITARSEQSNSQMVINTEALAEGIYLGSSNELKNFVNYQDENGQLFSSTKIGKLPSVVIQISTFNQQDSLVSGSFSGTLYSQTSEDSIIVSGQFTELVVNIPFIGEMTASIGNINYVSNGCTYTSTNNSGIILETIASTANDDTLSISIVVEENIQERHYNFAVDLVVARYNSNVFSSNIFKHQYTSITGSMDIKEIDLVNQRVVGSFTFVATNFLNQAVTVSNGNFKALAQ